MISTHILDTSLGHPAAQVTVQLEKKAGGSWDIIGTEKTNSDGRILFACTPEAGSYRLQFFVEDYFKKNKVKPFFTLVPVHFEISDTDRKYHVPLLLNPYGYSTYRGS
ncbi:MAG: hydroxyisourate hydrolase [Bdellovibrionota bacterium]